MKKFILIIMFYILIFSNLSIADEINRHNISPSQANPLRIKSEDFFYARLGYGAVIGSSYESGVALGFGYRYETDKYAADISIGNTIMNFGEQSFSGDFTFLKLSGLYFFNHVSDATLYTGLGVSYGSSVFEDSANHGIRGEATLGFEILRTSDKRLFFQTDFVLPSYTVKGRYVPSAGISFGIGW